MRGSCKGMRPSPQAAVGPTLNCSPGLGWRTEAMLWSPPAVVHGSTWGSLVAPSQQLAALYSACKRAPKSSTLGTQILYLLAPSQQVGALCIGCSSTAVCSCQGCK